MCWQNAEQRRVLAKCGARSWKHTEEGLVLAKCGAKPGFLSRAYAASRLEPRGASLRGEASSARSPRLSFMCHVRDDQQEAPAVFLL